MKIIGEHNYKVQRQEPEAVRACHNDASRLRALDLPLEDRPKRVGIYHPDAGECMAVANRVANTEEYAVYKLLTWAEHFTGERFDQVMIACPGRVIPVFTATTMKAINMTMQHLDEPNVLYVFEDEDDGRTLKVLEVVKHKPLIGLNGRKYNVRNVRHCHAHYTARHV